jgi:hypothetical protein
MLSLRSFEKAFILLMGGDEGVPPVLTTTGDRLFCDSGAA